jgi:uncharacterized delta-60 repeat protein/MYXO-CTERM domain-containing protein
MNRSATNGGLPRRLLRVWAAQWAILPALILMLLSDNALAAASSGVQGFGDQGRLVLQETGFLRSLQALPDNSFVYLSTRASALRLGRLNTAGARVTSFGNAGIVDIPNLNGAQTARSLWILPNGDLLAVGSKQATRLNAAGAIQTGYGSNGSIVFPEAVVGANIDGLGRLYAATFRSTSQAASIVVRRFTTDGLLDNAYGQAGVAEMPYYLTDHGHPAMALDFQGGKVLVAGSVRLKSRSTHDTAVARFTESGQPDSTFGDNGRAVIDIINNDGASTLKVQNGNIFVVGIFGFLIGQINDSGTTRTTTYSDFNNIDAWAIATLPDGRGVIAGSYNGPDSFCDDFFIQSINPNGTRDSRLFDGAANNEGRIRDFNGECEGANAVAILPNGNIVAGGGAMLDGLAAPAGEASPQSDRALKFLLLQGPLPPLAASNPSPGAGGNTGGSSSSEDDGGGSLGWMVLVVFGFFGLRRWRLTGPNP